MNNLMNNLVRNVNQQIQPTISVSYASIPMLTLVIKLELTHTHTSTISFSVIQTRNFRLTGALPCSLTPGFTETYLSSSEISWYTQGITIWAEAAENGEAAFDLEKYNSSLIAAGLQIE